MNKNDASQLSVSPMSVDFNLKNSGTEEGILTITNDSDSLISYKIYIEPYYVDENYNPTFTIENNYTQLANWITFKNDDGSFVSTYKSTLEAGASKELDYKIIMPEDAETYSQYAVVFAETDELDSKGTTGVLMTSRAGVLFSGRTGSLKLTSDGTIDNNQTLEVAGEINDVYLNKFLTGGNIEISANISNPGTTTIPATGKINIKNIFGEELYNVETTVDVLPETTRSLLVEWSATPIVGIFNVDYAFEAGINKNSDSQVVIKMPIVIMILIIIIFAVAIVSTIRLIKHHGFTFKKHFSIKSSLASRQFRRSRRSKIHWPKIRRSRGQKKGSNQ